MSAQVSIVLPAYNEGGRLFDTIQAIRETVNTPYEVIVVNDGSTDGCCDFLRHGSNTSGEVQLIELARNQGVAHARNLGAEEANGSVLVTMDAHCIPQAGWLSKMLDALDKPGVGIAAPQIRSIECPDATAFGLTISDRELGVSWLPKQSDRLYQVPLAGCACLVMNREFFETAGRFDALRSYGMEDVELCLRCWLLGYSVVMVPDAVVAHCFKKQPFAVGWHDFLYNRLRTALLHFEGPRLERILASLKAKPAFPDAVTSLLTSDIWARREFVRQARKHDADWFCRRFGIHL